MTPAAGSDLIKDWVLSPLQTVRVHARTNSIPNSFLMSPVTHTHTHSARTSLSIQCKGGNQGQRTQPKDTQDSGGVPYTPPPLLSGHNPLDRQWRERDWPTDHGGAGGGFWGQSDCDKQMSVSKMASYSLYSAKAPKVVHCI